jgi:hypothetical protein
MALALLGVFNAVVDVALALAVVALAVVAADMMFLV